MAQADGQVLIDTKIRTDGMEEGFQKIKNGAGDVADSVKRAGKSLKEAFGDNDAAKKIESEMAKIDQAAEAMRTNISQAFSGIDLGPIGNAEIKLQRLEAQADAIKDKWKMAVAGGDTAVADKATAELGDVYQRMEDARRSLAYAVRMEAEKQAAAEVRASQTAAKAAERATAAKKRAAAAEAKAAEKAAAAEAKAQKKRMKEAFKGLDRSKMRMSEIALGSIVYNTLGQAILSMTKYVGAALKSNDQFSASFAKVKGALLTAFQPIYEVVLPALISLMNVLSAVITVIGRFFAALAGKSYSQMQKNAEALHDQAGGIGAVGAAAKKAKRELAGFDEINKLSFQDASGGGGGAGIGEIGADFSDPEDIANLNQILYLVGAVAAALAGWKIAKLFTDDLGTIAGVAMAIGGAFLMAANWADAFANGIDWDNLSGMMAGFALVVGGLALAFGATGAAVGLLVGGVALVVLAIKDWIETGELGEEACAALTIGITAIGVAISLLTGGPIAAIIAAVAAFAIACVTNGDAVKDAFNGILDWIKGFFVRDWREVFGDTLGSIFNGFSEGIVGIIDGLKQTFGGLVDFIGGVFSGDWGKAWDGLVNIFKGIVNVIIGAVNGLVSGVCAGLNAIIKAINKISFTVPDWVPKFGGEKIGFNLQPINPPKIPYLAKGAVIPPNAPFLAMLGDQKHGTNIEAPLSTIQEAVAVVMEDMIQSNIAGHEATIAVLQQILEAVLGIEIDGETISNAVSRYNRKMSVMRGG